MFAIFHTSLVVASESGGLKNNRFRVPRAALSPRFPARLLLAHGRCGALKGTALCSYVANLALLQVRADYLPLRQHSTDYPHRGAMLPCDIYLFLRQRQAVHHGY